MFVNVSISILNTYNNLFYLVYNHFNHLPSACWWTGLLPRVDACQAWCARWQLAELTYTFAQAAFVTFLRSAYNSCVIAHGARTRTLATRLFATSLHFWSPILIIAISIVSAASVMALPPHRLLPSRLVSCMFSYLLVPSCNCCTLALLSPPLFSTRLPSHILVSHCIASSLRVYSIIASPRFVHSPHWSSTLVPSRPASYRLVSSRTVSWLQINMVHVAAICVINHPSYCRL